MDRTNTKRGPGFDDFIDLCSESEQIDNRQSKRRREMRQKPQEQIVDLSTPEGIKPSGADASERRLWGEVEEAPPRWSQARRRSALCPPGDMLNAVVAAPSLATSSFEPRGLRPSAGEAQDEGRDPQAAYAFWSGPRRARCEPPAPLDAERQPIGGLAGSPPLRPRSDAALARRLQRQEESAAAAQARETARRMEMDELTRRMDHLEELEAWEELYGQHDATWQPLPPPTAHHRSGRPNPQMRPPPQPRARQRYPDSLAEAMMGMLSGGGPLGGMHHLGAMSEHVAAMRRAWGGAPLPGRLPAHLMYSDRDFDENDYEMLLALDDDVASRRGASAEQIDAIPTVLVGGPGGIVEKDCRCLICLEDLEAGACLRKMKCKHRFHKACLDKWLAQKSTCPICQQSLGL